VRDQSRPFTVRAETQRAALRGYRRGAARAAVCLACAAAAGNALGSAAGLRILSVQTNCFDFTLMSAMRSADGAPLLVFNDLEGRTHMARPGEWLGPHTVGAFQATNRIEFVPSLNANLTRRGGRVELHGPGGETRVLVMGETQETQGWIACVVATNTGDWQFLREGDEVQAGSTMAVVRSLGPGGLTLVAGTSTQDVAWASESERAALRETWDARRREWEERLAARAPQRGGVPGGEAAEPVVRQAPPVKRPQKARRTVRFNLGGGDVPYPVEYEVVWMPSRSPSGKRVLRPVVIPKRFRRTSREFVLEF
jgi:hypothetical protein